MSYYTNDGQRRSTRSAGKDPPEPLHPTIATMPPVPAIQSNQDLMLSPSTPSSQESHHTNAPSMTSANGHFSPPTTTSNIPTHDGTSTRDSQPARTHPSYCPSIPLTHRQVPTHQLRLRRSISTFLLQMILLLRHQLIRKSPVARDSHKMENCDQILFRRSRLEDH